MLHRVRELLFVPWYLSQAATSLGTVMARQFDSRGQRKLKNGDALVAVIEGSQSDNTTGTVIRVGVNWRSQFKL